MATLNIRGLAEPPVKGIKVAAAAHGMTLPQYITALHALHLTVVAAAAESGADPETILAREFLDAVSLPLVVTGCAPGQRATNPCSITGRLYAWPENSAWIR